jgi:hypothetical protein
MILINGIKKYPIDKTIKNNCLPLLAIARFSRHKRKKATLIRGLDVIYYWQLRVVANCLFPLNCKRDTHQIDLKGNFILET